MKQLPTPEIIERLNTIMNDVCQYLAEEKFDEANKLQEEFYLIENNYDLFDRTFEENGKTGLKDITGKILVPPLYHGFLELYSYTIKRGAPVVAENEDRKCALVATDGHGTPLTEFQYDNIACKHYTAFYSCYKKENEKLKMGILCNSGREIVPCEMDMIYEVSNDIITLEKDSKYGFLTTWGQYFPPIYDEIEDDSSFVRVRIGEHWGYLSDKGDFIQEDDEDKLQDASLIGCAPEI